MQATRTPHTRELVTLPQAPHIPGPLGSCHIVCVTTPPQVDDADVARMIDFLFGKSINTNISAEERAEAAYQVALNVALSIQGTTESYAKALAEKVRAKALWIKSPTGGPVKMPE